MSFLVSVVVPTKNRYQYLKHLIRLIDSFKLSELEFVIQDNSDDNTEIRGYLKEYDNPSIKYYHTSDTLTMSQNGEQAILHASGEYVCYIGDDDGVCRNIVDCVRWMKAKGIDAAYNKNVWFMWGQSAKLLRPNKGHRIYSTTKELRSLLKKGCDLSGTNMPLLYHGIVKKSTIEVIYRRYGTLFPSVPPDISGSICLATVIDNCCELRTPVIINGISKMAGGGVISKGGVLKLEDVSFITPKDIDEWNKKIPPVWCGDYAWANSSLHTLEHIGQLSLMRYYNNNRCLTNAIITRPHKTLLWKLAFRYSNNIIMFIISTLWFCFTMFLNRLWNNRPGAVYKELGTLDIIQAEAFFMKYDNIFKNK